MHPSPFVLPLQGFRAARKLFSVSPMRALAGQGIKNFGSLHVTHLTALFAEIRYDAQIRTGDGSIATGERSNTCLLWICSSKITTLS